MSPRAMFPCVKCGAAATLETADTDEPMCFAHGGGEPPDVEPDDFDMHAHSDLDTDGQREV